MRYETIRNVRSRGKLYPPGSSVDLPKEQGEPLVAAGALRPAPAPAKGKQPPDPEE
ncbi:MAG: hypothetical protein ACLFSR_03875 [Halomonas sp.]